MSQSIKVRHTVQMGHRLWALPGKCTNLHGHTWTVYLTIAGTPDERGILIDYHEVKKVWRDFLDSQYDHHFAFDESDPLLLNDQRLSPYPGAVLCSGLPTVENLAMWWGEWARDTFGLQYRYEVELWEGENNCATWSD